MKASTSASMLRAHGVEAVHLSAVYRVGERPPSRGLRRFTVACIAAMVLVAHHATVVAQSIDGTVSPTVRPDSAELASRKLKGDYANAAIGLRIVLPPADVASNRAQGNQPLQVGFHRAVPDEFRGNLSSRMEWTPLAGGSIVSAVSVTSPEALAVRAGIQAELGPGGEIRFFGGSSSTKDGAQRRAYQEFPVMTRADFLEGAEPETVWSPIVEGDTIGIEITLPSRDALSDFSFSIEKISHIFDGLFGDVSKELKELECANHIDVQCRSGIAGNQQAAVGRIRFEEGEGTYVCSGTLLNDTRDDDYIPYFLTAQHCVSTSTVARTVEARWFYQRESCGGERIDSRYETTHGGAELLAASAAQDSTLLRFQRSLPGGLFHSGWSADSVSHPTQVYGIHHPDGGVKKFSAGRTTGHRDVTVCDDSENEIGCQTVKDAIRVAWSEGTTEGGSSGSGLFDGSQLIGVLFGGSGTCTSTIDSYGPFRHFFPRIRRWLSPVPYSVPFITAASNRSRPGFMRIINHSERAGTVSIHAIDDTGRRFGPVSLSLEAMQTRHFNSVDLENGNAAKGLSAGVGDGTGNWRLELSSELSIEALAYIRTADGFVTSMHEVAAATEEGSNRYHVPFVNPGSNSNQESLLRLINPGSGDASVVITGVDDAGDAPPLGEVSLTLAAGAARMLTAQELERGGSGLTGRLGDGTGKWRLSVTGDRPLQVVSLLQLPTGHLTNLSRGRASSDPVGWERSGTGPALFDLPVRIERIRIVGEFSGRSTHFSVWCGGPDDHGGLLVSELMGTSWEQTRYSGVHSARRSYNGRGEPCRQLHIKDSEGDRNPGEGVRWTISEASPNASLSPAVGSGDESVDRLSVERARAQEALRSRVRPDDRGTPTGNAARRDNRRVVIETVRRAANFRQSKASSTTTQTLPLVTPASERGRPGFMRIINHSERAGTVSIHAIDDTGERFGPVSLSLEAMQTRHFNSVDLENGNAAKGLSAGVGDGTGNWRLELSSELSIEALAYIRTPDGFVTSMHEVAAATEEGSNRYHVPFVNPGSNSNQESLLRLINPGSGDASVVITGVDDAGDAPPMGEVRLTLGAGAARMLSARELERGDSGLTGRLGDGTGKWRLSVTGDRPLQVVSLLQLPTGHLTNLSRGRDGVAAGTPQPPDAPDLVVQTLSVSDSSPNPGQSFTLRTTVRNTGTARSGATTLRYYRSTDATISTSDTRAGTDAVSGLAVSGTSPESISLLAPSTAGTYYYGSCVDAVTGESNTGNNCSSAVRVTVGGGGGTRFGAFAADFDVSPSCPGLAAGIAINHGSAQEALDAAVRACQNDGGSASNCRADAVSFQGGCAAMSYGEDSPIFDCGIQSAAGSTRSAAESAALTKCRSEGYSGCRVWVNKSGQRMSGCNSQGNSAAGTETTGRTRFQMQSKRLRTP